MTSRRTLVASGTAVAVASIVAAAPAPASDGTTAWAVVDGALARAAAAGPTGAVLTWDRTQASSQQVAQHLAAAGVRATLLDGSPVAFACAGGSADVRALAAAPGAVSVWGEQSLQTAAVGSSGSGAVHADAPTQDLGVDGTGVSVAVVDTGLDGRHQAFGERITSNVRVLVSHREFLGPGDPPPCQDVYTADLEDSELTSGHGTHLAGVAAGGGSAAAGLAPNAGVVGVGISDSVVVDTDVRDDTRLSMFGALAGLYHALDRGLSSKDPVKAVVAGWVGPGLHDPFHPISLAIRDLHDFGVTVVLPFGNGEARDSDCSQAETCQANPYAVGPFAVGVAAASAKDHTRLAGFSARGDRTPREVAGLEVAYEPLLSAPGEDVVGPRRLGTANLATVPGSPHAGGGDPSADQSNTRYVAMSGTSVAAAEVAGAVVLMQQAARESSGCYLPTQHVRRLLAESAAPMPEHPRWEAGAGLLDVGAAVQAARAHEPDPKTPRWLCPRTEATS